jgi:hypothetical protein
MDSTVRDDWTPVFVARIVSATVGLMGVGWLAAALLQYSNAGTPFIHTEWFLLWFAGLLLVPVTGAALVVVAVAHRRVRQRLLWLGALTPPLALVIWFAAVSLWLPLRVRLFLSQDSLASFSADHAEGDRDHRLNRRVGLFNVEEFDVVEGCTRFITADSFVDDAGLVYCPEGNHPPHVGEDSYDHLFGNWWHWHRSW